MERLVKNQRKDGQKKLFSEERLDGKIFGSDFLTKQNEINEKKKRYRGLERERIQGVVSDLEVLPDS